MKTNPPEIIEFPEQTVVIAKDQPPYRPLPAYRYANDPEGKIVCCWKLDFLARLKVLFTGKLWHQILTFNHPLQPQLMMIDKPEMPQQFFQSHVGLRPEVDIPLA